VLFHDTAYDIESQPGPFPNFFGREERLEQLIPNTLGNAAAVIYYFRQQKFLVVTVPIYFAADRKRAAIVHGVDGVIDQVGPDLVEFSLPPADGWQVVRKIDRQLYVFALKLMAEQRQCILNTVGQPEGIPTRTPVHVGVILDRCNQRSNSLRRVTNIVHQPLGHEIVNQPANTSGQVFVTNLLQQRIKFINAETVLRQWSNNVHRRAGFVITQFVFVEPVQQVVFQAASLQH